jgi:hypothetical protein
MADNRQNPFAVVGLIILFALAIGVFIGVAYFGKRLLAGFIENEDLRTVISFIIAAAATLIFLQCLKFVNRYQTKRK